MENENNKQNNQKQKHWGRKNHKPKSYFIDPPTQNDGTATAPKQAEAIPEEQAQRPQKKKQDRHQGKHHGGNQRSVEQPQRETEGKPLEEQSNADPQKAKGQAEQKPTQGNQGNQGKKKKKHHSRKQGNAQNQQISADTKQGSPSAKDEKSSQTDKPAKKKYERPGARQHELPSTEINEADYDMIQFRSASEDIVAEPVPEKMEAPTIEVVGIRFKSSGKTYYFTPDGKTLRRGEHAIVETARGLEFGEVAMGNSLVRESDTVPPLRPILRIATPADVKHHEENKKKEDEAFAVCNQKINEHKLDMKLIDAQFTFDNSKLLFYFTSSGRVDFRELVKDLAGVFRTRIELRQIGIRDEAKIMGGVGMCGRPLCCTLFLSDFGQVSIKMAKEQNLSLNCSKISGICGRLMCCLRYEHDTYEYEIKHTPPVDSLVRTADGNGMVTEIHPLAGTIKVRLLATPDNPPKLYRREDVVMLQKKQNKDNSNNK